jgi:elongation factor 2
MAKKEDVAKLAQSLMSGQKEIRNLGIVAHIDHGKSTLSDNLVAASGLISEELAGKQLFMDSYELEQERGITINAANVSLVYDKQANEKYLINLIDTPGHVDFSGDVIRAMRAVDGVIVVVDVVEGVMPQTETVLRQALKEYVKPVLFLNKVDRLMTELQVTEQEMQERFIKVIGQVNKVISDFCPKDKLAEWTVGVQDGSVAFGSAYNNWAVSFESIKSTGVGFKEVYEYCRNEDQKTLAKKSPLFTVALDMVIKHLPNPIEAQKYRSQHIWHGDLSSNEGKSMVECDSSGPFSMMITDVSLDTHAGDVATGRIYSGTIKRGDEVCLVGTEKKVKIQQVAIYMGPDRVIIENAPAGNIASLVGLKEVYAGMTVASKQIKEFESFKTNLEPVITMSIEPKDPKDLSKIVEVIKQITKEDPNVKAVVNQETGEFLLSGMGELHLEIIQHRIQKDHKIPIIVSPPIVMYQETITKAVPDEIEAKTPNKHNKFKIRVEPIAEEIYEKLVESGLKGKIRDKKDEDKIAKLIEMGFNKDIAKKIWAINNNSVIVNRTRGVIHIGEVKELIIQAFVEATNAGPLTKERVTRALIFIEDAILHEDAIHRGPAQVLPAMSRGIYAGILLANPVLLEPKQKLYISFPNDYLGVVTKELNNRRVQLEDMKTEGEETIITSKAPIRELIGFSNAIRSTTQGRVLWSAEYWGYERLPPELQKNVVKEIRLRKGLSPEPQEASYFMD